MERGEHIPNLLLRLYLPEQNALALVATILTQGQPETPMQTRRQDIRMYFLYIKSSGKIGEPIRSGQPDKRTIDKEPNCGIGSGVKWENVDLFYSDEEFPEDFVRTAPLGKYYIENDEVKENADYE